MNRDWLEADGNYTNTCSVCGEEFIGLKRRIECRLCVTMNFIEAQAAWFLGKKVRRVNADYGYYEQRDLVTGITMNDRSIFSVCPQVTDPANWEEAFELFEEMI